MHHEYRQLWDGREGRRRDAYDRITYLCAAGYVLLPVLIRLHVIH